VFLWQRGGIGWNQIAKILIGFIVSISNAKLNLIVQNKEKFISNVFSFVGTVTRDAEVRFTPAGMAVLNVNVANNQGFGDKQKTMFIRVAVFGKKAESKLKDFLVKGAQIMVSGELSMNEYKANDGTMKTSLELTANIIDLVGKKSEGGAPAASPARGSAPAQPPVSDNFDEPFDDQIPF